MNQETGWGKAICGLVLASALLAATLRQAGAEQVLTNDTVVQMSGLQLGDDIIIKKIEASACQFDTSPQALSALKRAGVSAKVIEAMIGSGQTPAPGTLTLAHDMLGLAGSGNQYSPWDMNRVRVDYSHRKSWIPYYGSYAGSEEFIFLPELKAKNRLHTSRPEFVTNVEALRLRLVKLGDKKGERYVVYSKGKSDEEIPFTAKPLGTTDNSLRVTVDKDLDPGEYAFLVIPSTAGFVTAEVPIYGAFDFGVDKK